MTATATGRYARVWEPVQVGTMELRNRIMVPTHASGAGFILGSEREAERFIAYYVRRAQGGAGWIGGSSTFVEAPLIPGYDPSGVGAVARGSFRHPLFLERHRRYMDALHAAGARGTLQMIVQGGLPHGASQDVSGFVLQEVPHAVTREEIAQLVAEYGWSAAQALEAGVDGVEIHGNHDDLVQFFLSPLSNRRDDEYGGALAGRMRFLLEALGAIRDAVGDRMTVGTRLCLDELIPGGYDADVGLEMAQVLDESGLVDYLHVDVGNNWGAPSYLPPMHYQARDWTALAGRVRAAVDVPVIYTGRVNHPDVAEGILADGHADLVGMARALIADPDLPRRAREGTVQALRPCVGTNDCLHRVIVDRVRFSCAVNPGAGHETVEVVPAAEPERILVVGGGPAGLEVAALAAERGHDVTLWEREAQLGGQLAIAALAPAQSAFAAFVEFQRRRLAATGVTVELGREATAVDVVGFGAGSVVIATGAGPRRPDVPGVDLPHVVELRDVLTGKAQTGARVLLAVGDENAAPLLGADQLASQGCDVRVVYPGPQIAPKVGKYSLGGYMERLFRNGVRFIPMQRVTRIEPDVVHAADVYAGVPVEHRDLDTVVLAYGGLARSRLHAELTGRVGKLHIVGDAWSPRRLTTATRQAWELGRRL